MRALIALYENATPFEYNLLDPMDREQAAAFAALWPIGKFPVLEDDGRVIGEASIIIEHLDLHHPGPVRLVPSDPGQALEVRLLDRIFDNYISTPQQTIIFNSIRPEADRDPYGDRQARDMLDRTYGWLDGYLDGRTWAVGDTFTLADCAAAPALFYADWTHRIDEGFANLHAYRRRLLARPSFARAGDEARPYRSDLPLGAPDRD